MRKQEIFDTVATHLLEQGEKAVNGHGYCVFVNERGQRCALGVLVPNISPHRNEYTLPSIKEIKPDDMPELAGSIFLTELRKIHDRKEPHTWRSELRKLAEEYDLSGDILYTKNDSIEDLVNDLDLEEEKEKVLV